MDARLSIARQRSDRMWTGIVDSIYIAERAKQPTKAVPEVKASPGVGLDGDRYARKQGTFYKPEPDFELTVIEAEAIEALKREYKVELSLAEARRNLVTRDVPLNHLVGREFHVGEVKIRGIRLCEPCEHLQAIVQRPVIKGLRHRGGLRAQILTEGVIRVGDVVRE